MAAEPRLQEDDPHPLEDIGREDMQTPKASYKSFKKKYYKIRATFDEKMRESNNIFREEQRMQDISRRLAEQNDQLLELLFDLNECPELSPEFRYDLETDKIDSKKNSGPSDETYDIPAARATLEEAKQELRSGELSPIEYKRLQESILRSRPFAPSRAYKSLLPLRHQDLPNSESGGNQDNDASIGFVRPDREEQYLQDLDAFLSAEVSTRRPSSYSSQLNRVDRASERDRETNLKNPVSVYNWLRKHQPQVFLQDKENEEKAAKAWGGRTSKRASTHIKAEAEMYDEDGIALDVPKASGKRKRQKDDDGGYRPKGGGARATKRKRESGGPRRSIAE